MPLIPTRDAAAAHDRIPSDELRVATTAYVLVRNAEGRYQIATSLSAGVPAAFVVNGDGRLQVAELPVAGEVTIVRLGPSGPFIL